MYEASFSFKTFRDHRWIPTSAPTLKLPIKTNANYFSWSVSPSDSPWKEIYLCKPNHKPTYYGLSLPLLLLNSSWIIDRLRRYRYFLLHIVCIDEVSVRSGLTIKMFPRKMEYDLKLQDENYYFHPCCVYPCAVVKALFHLLKMYLFHRTQ